MRIISAILGFLLLAAQPPPIFAQQQTAKPVTQPGQPAADAAAADPGWPRIYTNGTATLAVHQPQVDDWKDFELLQARMAFELLPEKGAKKLLAAVHWEAKTKVDLDNRTVALGDINITRFSIPGLDEAKTKEMEALAVSLLPKKRDVIALDRILPYLDKSRTVGRPIKIATAPPPIMVSTKPAILVMLDGQPILGPITGTKLTYIVNTNWDLFKEGKDGDFFLLDKGLWLTADSLEGPWKSASKLPKDINSLPADENWADVRKALPLSKENKSKPAPWVYITYKPAELILLQGEPQMTPIPGTEISEVTNTKTLLFFHSSDKNYYYLTSGRWFRNQQLRGNWEYASDKLPTDFQKIPPNHPKAAVLSSVPGTEQAKDAVMLASIPQVAVINKKQAEAEAKVAYIGAPEFKPVTGTELQYATNTPSDVIKYEDKYYLCQQGVWFVAGSPNGPWQVAQMVPQEIYKIPPDSPKHNTTYVYVTSADQDTVTTAQTAGYLGMAVGIGVGVAVWGTGYYYPPYYYYGPMYPYPVYWGYPYHTYGAAAWYNPATGFYGRGAVAYGPYGGYGRAAAYNPATGTYARRAAAYGPYQAGMATSFYNPRTGAWGGGYRYANPYQGWGQGVVAKGDQWARGGYYYDDRGAIGGIRTSEGGKMIAAGNGENRGMIGRTSDGDLYVGKDGEMYRRDQNGNWQQRTNGGWNNVNYDSLTPEQKQRVDNAKQSRQQPGQTGASNRSQVQQPGQAARETTGPRPNTGSVGEVQRNTPSSTNRDVMNGLDRDAGARSRGSQNYDNWKSQSRSSGSYGGGGRAGGGFRGGGRRR